MKILYPLKRPIYITQKYGARPEYYKQFKIGGVPLKGHEGLDLRAINGDEVTACYEGTIAEAFDQGAVGYGKYIKIIHSWGESVYAHLQEFKIKKGDKVSKGQVVALADNTGNSSGSHLHFSIRINPYNKSDGWGGYSNPEPYFGGEDEMNDQTKIDLGNEIGVMEVQAIRSTILDQRRIVASQQTDLDNLKKQVDLLKQEIVDLKASLGSPSEPQPSIEPSFTNPLAQLLYGIAKRLG